jgi:hypothetical protein
MASHIHRINTLKAEISNLEFRKEMFWQSHAYDICGAINIDEILAGLNARDTQIAELQSRLDELLVALPVTEGINLAIHDQQTRPPISSLPYEMLSAVFEKGSLPLSASYQTKFALSVSQVSRYWRETAMQTPFLWSGICLLPWRNRGGYREFLKILVQRSQPHPLNIAWKNVKLVDDALLLRCKCCNSWGCAGAEARICLAEVGIFSRHWFQIIIIFVFEILTENL